MATIYRDSTDLLTIGQAKRLIIGAMPTELGAPVFAAFTELGDLIPDSLTVLDPVETCFQADFIDRDFVGLCQQQGITPRHKYRPLFTDFSGAAQQDDYYTITHDEFVKLAILYGATVAIGAAPAQTTATPEPVVAASDGPAPLTTGDIAHCFNGLRWDEKGWKDTLGSDRKWLNDCLVTAGQRGVNERRWNPVLIGAWLAVNQGHVSTRQVRARFQTVDLLKPWFDAWITYEADNCDTP